MINEYDAGGTVWSIEMGGMGPGYEQAIQVGVIESCRAHAKYGLNHRRVPTPEYAMNTYLSLLLDDAMKADPKWLDGLSGAQAGAVMNIVANYLRKGYGACIDEWRQDKHLDERMIQVDRLNLADETAIG